MLLHQKIARVIADKGFTGLWDTLGSAVQKNRTSSAPDPSCDRVSQQHVRDYEQICGTSTKRPVAWAMTISRSITGTTPSTWATA